MAEHVRNYPTTWRGIERRARAYRPQSRRVTVAAQTGFRASPHEESRPPALSRHGPDRRTLLAAVPSEPSKATVATTESQPAYVGGGPCLIARVTAPRLVAPFRASDVT